MKRTKKTNENHTHQIEKIIRKMTLNCHKCLKFHGMFFLPIQTQAAVFDELTEDQHGFKEKE